YRVVARVGIPREERRSGNDHARRAVAALQRAAIDERLLYRMQATVARKAFDRCDPVAANVVDRCDARAHHLAADEHAARSTRSSRSYAATVSCGRQAHLLALRREHARFGVGQFMFGSVDQDPHAGRTVAVAGPDWWLPKWLQKLLPDLDIEGEHNLPAPEFER